MNKKTKKWSEKEIIFLKKMVKRGIELEEISKNISGRSQEAIRKKIRSLDLSLEDVSTNSGRKWTEGEIMRLAVYLEDEHSYKYISEKLNRSVSSVRHKAQTLSSGDIQNILSPSEESSAESIESPVKEQGTDKEKDIVTKYIHSFMAICRNEIHTAYSLDKEYFLDYLQIEDYNLPIPFEEIKSRSIENMKALGFSYPLDAKFGPGTYLIIGDSHGKHTSKEMVKLIENVSHYTSSSKIIHVGHIVDDDNHINLSLINLQNLLVVAKVEELKLIKKCLSKIDTKIKADALVKSKGVDFYYIKSIIKRIKLEVPLLQSELDFLNSNLIDIDYLKNTELELDIVRDSVFLGDCGVFNQDMINEYALQSVSSLDSSLFSDMFIVNNHKHELFTKCTNKPLSYVATPGCICEKHVVRTVKQQDFLDHRIVKLAYHEGFKAYRRKKHMCDYWEQGLIVVHVDKNKNHSIEHCVIKKLGEDLYGCSINGEIVTNKGVFRPDKKIFVAGDAHSSKYDENILDIQDQIVKDYKPDVFVNLGDLHNNESLNHHKIDKNEAVSMDILEECAKTCFIAKKMSKWAPEIHLLKGNHERFSDDFINQYPQFKKLLDVEFLCSVENMDYICHDLKEHLDIDGVTFIHGDTVFYNQRGTKLEKAVRTYGRDVFIGHIHKPEIRMGGYSIGLTGLLDQEYNEPDASSWAHGFGTCSIYKGVSFSSSYIIRNNSVYFGSKLYSPKNPKDWNLDNYSFKPRFTFEFIKNEKPFN